MIRRQYLGRTEARRSNEFHAHRTWRAASVTDIQGHRSVLQTVGVRDRAVKRREHCFFGLKLFAFPGVNGSVKSSDIGRSLCSDGVSANRWTKTLAREQYAEEYHILGPFAERRWPCFRKL